MLKEDLQRIQKMSSKWAVRVPHLSAVVQFVSSKTIHWRLEEHIGPMDTQKKAVDWPLHLRSSYIMRYKSNSSLSSEKGFNKNLLKNWINALFFVWSCSVCYYPVQSHEWRGLLHMQHIARGRVTTENCQSVTAATTSAEHPASAKWRGGHCKKPWHRIHHTLHYIYDTKCK